MSVPPRSLRGRLFVSYVLVVAAGAVAMVVVGTVVTRSVYRRELRGVGFGRGPNRSTVDQTQLTDALDVSLLPALLTGIAAALVVGALAAWFVGRRLLRPLDEVREATRRMAAGDYSTRVTPPSESELASLAADVNRLGDHLADTERRRSQLLGEVTHELRTPLTVIGGHVEGMLDGVIDRDDATLALLSDEAKRVERLVDDLTLLSRADEGTLTVRMEPLDLADVVDDVVRRFAAQFQHRGVSLDDTVARPLPVVGDAQRLAQILANVVGNALEHTPHDGRVAIRGGTGDGTSWIEVTDTGDGLAADQLEAVFERFHRGPTGSGHQGRGIGLTVSRSLARAHGGDLAASSPGLGHGATFRLTLPSA